MMKTERNRFTEARLKIPQRPQGVYWPILCLLMIVFFAACSAGTPSREAPEPSAGSVSEKEPQTAEEAQLQEPSTANNIYDDYRIGSSDLLQIDVFQVPEFSQAVRVNSQGFISLPLIGSVQVNGLTSQQLEASLAKLLGEKYLQDPQVSVFIEEYASQRVTVEGAVIKPGIYPIQGRTTLLQALASAEGVNEVAEQGRIKLFRAAGDNTKQILYYDIDAIRQGVTPDPEIHADDIIVVEESGAKVFFRGFTNYFRLFLNPLVFF